MLNLPLHKIILFFFNLPISSIRSKCKRNRRYSGISTMLSYHLMPIAVGGMKYAIRGSAQNSPISDSKHVKNVKISVLILINGSFHLT